MDLQLVIDNGMKSHRLPDAVAFYATLIDERRSQLQRDLEYYIRKIADAADLDPANRTGLKTIYKAHAQHIKHLLECIG